ncbi:hypothetical protein K380107A5_19120 [Holdemania massiliensis]|uniref:cyclic-phosphate processing receiver domain-containing protein n=1 Tax=Holdemania massiliensis TaxID=1468449 RepID=UPI0036F198B0
MTKQRCLYLDDLRLPQYASSLKNCKFALAKTVSQAQQFFSENTYDLVSLDDDLGTPQTGYDFCLWLVQQPQAVDLKQIVLHTDNHYGRANMLSLLTWKLPSVPIVIEPYTIQIKKSDS